LGESLAWVDRVAPGRAGLSPHAPYSTWPELLRLVAEVLARRPLLLSTHVAESEEEFEMFTSRGGALHGWLKGQRPMDDCGLGTPVVHLARHGLLSPRMLAVHLNYLGPGDAELLGASGAGAVHCPRSHAYFGHAPFPLERLEGAGVPVCLGTDSLATVRGGGGRGLRLDLFAEMQAFARGHPGVSPGRILEMVTVRPARAMQLGGVVGELSAGVAADLVVVPLEDWRGDPLEKVVQHEGPVAASMIGGRWAIPPAEHG
jgi:aminodeoxyfutalosine deaminase